MKLTFPWLSDDYVSDWARTVQPGAGKDRGAMVLPEVGDEVLVVLRAGRHPPARTCSAACTTASTPRRTGGIDLIDGGSGAVNRRSLVSRRGPPDRPARRGRPDRGHHAGHHRTTSCSSRWTRSTPRSPCTATARSLIEGKGIIIDSASSELELKGGQISIKATNGVKVDGGSGAVDGQASGQLAEGSTPSSRAAARPRSRAARRDSVIGSHGQDQLIDGRQTVHGVRMHRHRTRARVPAMHRPIAAGCPTC